MSHANTGYSEETVQNQFCEKFLANTYKNLKLRPILELWGQIGDLTAFQTIFNTNKC